VTLIVTTRAVINSPDNGDYGRFSQAHQSGCFGTVWVGIVAVLLSSVMMLLMYASLSPLIKNKTPPMDRKESSW